MTHISRDSSYYKDDERIGYYDQISPEYQFEKPAIDRLLDYISNQESQKPAIDILIQEYLERIGSPLTYQSTQIAPLMDITLENDNDNKNTCTQQTQTPTRGIQYYQSTYPTPLTSSNDIMYDSNHDYRNTASTPLLPPLSARSYRSSSIVTDGVGSTPSIHISTSSNQETSIVDRFTKVTNSQENRLKRAAAEERRHFGKVQPGLIWTAPLPVRPRIFSIRPPALSCKIFLGGIPHDLNPRDLQERLENFGSVRLEWPNKDNVPMHKHLSNHTISSSPENDFN
ncbi:unnamed protein product [Rotaria sp. Silwood1]|nr:unnamed protein product [Rotaria sp. Silwood1]